MTKNIKGVLKPIILTAITLLLLTISLIISTGMLNTPKSTPENSINNSNKPLSAARENWLRDVTLKELTDIYGYSLVEYMFYFQTADEFVAEGYINGKLYRGSVDYGYGLGKVKATVLQNNNKTTKDRMFFLTLQNYVADNIYDKVIRKALIPITNISTEHYTGMTLGAKNYTEKPLATYKNVYICAPTTAADLYINKSGLLCYDYYDNRNDNTASSPTASYKATYYLNDKGFTENPAEGKPVLTTDSIALSNFSKSYGDKAFTLALTNKGLGSGAVTYTSSNTSVATISGSTCTILKPGTTTITATKAADAVYFGSTTSCTLTVNQADISGATVTAIANQPYTGNKISPTNLSVTAIGKKLIENTDYTLTYGANLNVGTNAGTVTITGKTNYKGSKTINFNITAANQNFSVSNSIAEWALGNKTYKLNTANGKGTITFTSSNTAVATVTADGTVTFIKAGTVNIVATADGKMVVGGKTYQNYNAKSITTTIKVVDSVAKIGTAYFSLLNTAIDTATSGQTIEILTNISNFSYAKVIAKNLTIQSSSGDNLRTVNFAANSAFNVTANTLTLKNIAFDGGQKASTLSPFTITNGNMDLENVNITNFNITTDNSVIKATSGTITLKGSTSITNNKCINSNTGGAIYLSSTAKANLGDKVVISNNSAKVGSGIYAEDASELKVENSSISDTIFLASNNDATNVAKVIFTGNTISNPLILEVDSKVTAKYINNTLDDKYIVISSENSLITSATLKQFVRVKNSGYTAKIMDSPESYNLTLIRTSAYVAAIGTFGDTSFDQFLSVQEAIDKAIANLTNGNNWATVYIIDSYNLSDNTWINNKIVELKEALTIKAGYNITLISAMREVDTNGITVTLKQLTTQTLTLKRVGVSTAMITTMQGASLTIDNLILDGGAVWANGNAANSISSSSTSPSAVTAQNNGVFANAPIIQNYGTVTLNAGTILQNNENKYSQVSFGSENYGGGIANLNGAKLTLNVGAKISNCYAREGGGIQNVNKNKTAGGFVKIFGTIEYCVSQTKGAAVETIYGGANSANTLIGNGAKLLNNLSLNNLGVVTVEEGGAVYIESGSQIDAAENNYAVYIYNRYSSTDIKPTDPTDPLTTPYVEKIAAAKLSISGNAIINGKIFLDKYCTVIDSAPLKYEPVIIATAYTGAMLHIDLPQDANSGMRIMHGALSIATVTGYNANPNGGISKRFTYFADEHIRLGGYDLQATQEKDNRFSFIMTDVYGLTSAIVDIGGVEVIADITNNQGVGSIQLSAISTPQLLDVKVKFLNNGTSVTQTHPNSILRALVSTNKGALILPGSVNNLQIKTDSGQFITLSPTGLLPNNALITDSGKITISNNGVQQDIYVGTREVEPIPDPTITGTVKDFDKNQVTITVSGQAGYEYNLTDSYGNVIKTDWKIVNNDGTVVFTELLPDTLYNIVARKIPTDSTKLPSIYVKIDEMVTLTENLDSSKKDFEADYESIKNQLLPDGSDYNESTFDKITNLITKGEGLDTRIKEITSIKEKMDNLYVSKALGELKTVFDSYEKNHYLTRNDDLLTDTFKQIEEIYLTAQNEIKQHKTSGNEIDSSTFSALVNNMQRDMAAVKTAQQIINQQKDLVTNHYDTLIDKADSLDTSKWSSTSVAEIKKQLEIAKAEALAQMDLATTHQGINSLTDGSIDALNKIYAQVKYTTQGDHKIIIDKPTNSLTKDDLGAIDLALSDMVTDDYTANELSDIEDIRNDLLKKKKAIYNTDLNALKADKSQLSAKIIDDYNKLINDLPLSGDNNADKEVSKQYDQLYNKCKNTLALQEYYENIIKTLEYNQLTSKDKTMASEKLDEYFQKIKTNDLADSTNITNDGKLELDRFVSICTAQNMRKADDNTVLAKIIYDAINNLNNLQTNTKAEMNDIVNQLKIDLELERARNNAIDLLNNTANNSINSGKYSTTSQENINNIATNGTVNISNATTSAQIEQILADSIDSLNKIMPNALGSGELKPDSGNNNTGDSHPEYDSSNGNENGEIIGGITGGQGFESDWNLVIKKTESDINAIQKAEKANKKLEVDQTFTVGITDGSGNVKVAPNGTYSVSVLLTSSQRNSTQLAITFLAEDGTIVALNANRQGNFIVFSTDKLGTFQLLCDKKINLTWLIVALSVIALAEAAFLTFRILKRKKDNDGNNNDASSSGKKDSKMACSALPLMLIGAVAYTPKGAVSICIILAAVILALASAIILTYKYDNNSKKTNQDKKEELN